MTRDTLYAGVDVSTTAVKSIAWTAEGQAVAEARRPLETSRLAPGYFEQDAEAWWRAVCDCLGELAAGVGPGAIRALAFAHQRETFVPVDADGRPTGPALLWLDSRASDWIDHLRDRIDPERLRTITGKTPNYGLSLYKLAWLRDEAPEAYARASYFLDIQGFLAGRLTGRWTTSYSAADPTGLYDIRGRHWDRSLCEAVGVDPEQLPTTVAPGEPLGRVGPQAAAATGLAEGTPLFAAGGDGQATGLGVGAVGRQRGYINLGTAVVAGLYSAEPAVHAGWRTLCSGGSSGYYLESSLRSGALLADWYLKGICGLHPDGDDATFATIERDAAALPPGSRGLLLLPYWEAVMNPHWDEHAHGAVLGLTSDHDRAAVYRALVEGIALAQAQFLDAAAASAGTAPSCLIAMGGLAASDLWCQILADVTGVPIDRSTAAEAASLGAAMCAAAGLGGFATPEAASEAMAPRAAERFEPEPEHYRRYRELLAIYTDAYPQLRSLLHRLDVFAREG